MNTQPYNKSASRQGSFVHEQVIAPARGAACNNMDWHKYFTYKDGRLFHKERAPEDFKIPNTAFRWNERFSGRLADTSKQGSGYRLCACPAGQKLAHRVIWEMHHGPIPNGFVLDHTNGVREDNRIENLRTATCAQNSQNARTYSNNVLGIKGVTKKRGRYHSRIHIGGKQIHLGTYASPEETHNAYETASAKYHGEYGKTK